MDFKFGTLLIMPILGIALSLFMARLDSDAGYNPSTRGRNHDSRKFRASFLASQLVLIIIGNVFTLGISALTTQSDSAKYSVASICDVMGQMGLQSERSYPVEVGARMGGAYGDGYFWSGLFSSRGSVSITPGSALSVGFDYQGKSAILELPMRNITFIKDSSSTQPTIALKLDCGRKVDASQIVHYGPSYLRLDSGVLVMAHDEIGRDERVLDMSSSADGLAPLVASTLKSVEIRLSPELYDKILG